MTDYSQARAVVVGGWIGGLTTALLLRDSGFHVDVFERTPTALDGRGSGIVLQPDTVRWFQERSSQDLGDLQTATRFVQYLDRSGDVVHREPATWTYTSWGTFYRALLADFGTEHYHYGEYACGFDQDEAEAVVRFVSGWTAAADLWCSPTDHLRRSGALRPRRHAAVRRVHRLARHRGAVGTVRTHPQHPARCHHL